MRCSAACEMTQDDAEHLLISCSCRQNHHGLSYQDPGFIDHVVNKQGRGAGIPAPAEQPREFRHSEWDGLVQRWEDANISACRSDRNRAGCHFCLESWHHRNTLTNSKLAPHLLEDRTY